MFSSPLRLLFLAAVIQLGLAAVLFAGYWHFLSSLGVRYGHLKTLSQVLAVTGILTVLSYRYVVWKNARDTNRL